MYHIDTIKRKKMRKKFLLVMRTLRIYSLSKFPVHPKAALNIIYALHP